MFFRREVFVSFATFTETIMHLGPPPPPHTHTKKKLHNHCFLCKYNEYLFALHFAQNLLGSGTRVLYEIICCLVCLKGCYRYIKKIFQQLEVTTGYFCLLPEYFVKLFRCVRQKVPKEISPSGFYPLNGLKQKPTEFFSPSSLLLQF